MLIPLGKPIVEKYSDFYSCSQLAFSQTNARIFSWSFSAFRLLTFISDLCNFGPGDHMQAQVQQQDQVDHGDLPGIHIAMDK